MKRRKLRCYRAFTDVDGTYNNEVFYAAPEGYRLELATCTSCGEVFIVDRENPDVGQRPTSEVDPHIVCPRCGVDLKKSLSPYPETFVGRDGRLGSFIPPSVIPPDKESVVMDLWALESKDWAKK